MPIDFHETMMGKQFYTSTMPRIADALERIAELLEEQMSSSSTNANESVTVSRQQEFKGRD